MINKEEYENSHLEIVNTSIDDKLKELNENINGFKKKISKDNKEVTEVEVITLKNKQEAYNEIYENQNTPYFARMDFKFDKEDNQEIIYIGKIGIEFEDERYNITDWRTPLGNIYYKGSLGQCTEIFTDNKGNIRTIAGEKLLKRRIEIEDKKIVKIQDLETIAETKEKEMELADKYLIEVLKDSSSSKLKDIIATIQQTQNNIIREELNKIVCIQGCAGSGKSTIALHRIAYLLYYYNGKITDEDILIIAPNKLFIEYISDLLPDLGAVNIKQDTFATFVKYIINKDINYIKVNDQTKNKNNSINKGDFRFKELLDIYINYLVNDITPKQDLSIYGVTLFTKEEIKKIFLEDFNTYKINDRIVKFITYVSKVYNDKIKEYINQKDKEYEIIIENLKKELKNYPRLKKEISELIIEKENMIKRITYHSKLILKEYFKNMNQIDAVEKYRDLISNKGILGYNAITILSSKEINMIVEKSKDGLYEDDLAVILYLYSKINNVDDKFYKHIVIDESQDLSPFEIYTLRSFVYNNSFTIVGDINQRIIPDKLTYEESIMKSIFNDLVNFKEYKLNRSYRSSYEIMMFAKETLKFNSVNKEYLPDPIERHGDKPLIIGKHSDDEIVYEIGKLLEDRDSKYSNVAIVFRDNKNCEKYYKILKDKINIEYITEEKKYSGGICIFPAYLTKGLEFDMVIIGDCDNKSYGNNRLETNLLYVQSTRAMHKLVIMYSGAMSPLLLKIGKEYYEENETDQEKLFKIKIAKDSLMMLLNAKFGEINDQIDEIIKEELNYDRIQSFIAKAAIEHNLETIFEINIKKESNLKEDKDLQEFTIENIIENFLEDMDIEERENETFSVNEKFNEFKREISRRIIKKKIYFGEKQIMVAEYIENNIENITNIKRVSDLSKILNVSPATITNVLMRLNLGTYKNFIDEIMKYKK